MKSFILIIILALSIGSSFAQTDSIAIPAAGSIPVKSTLTLAAVYSNNAGYYGQRAEGNIPYAAIAAVYQHKSGFYLTGQSFKILNEKTSSVSSVSFGAGVNFKSGKRFTTDISYSHSFYPDNSLLLQASNADNASIALAYTNWLKVSLTGDYAFGKTNDVFVTSGISKSIDLFSIGKKDVVSINPSADVVGGTQRFFQTYVTEKKLRDSLLGIVTDPLFGNSSSTTTNKVATTEFDVLSYNFKCPVAYNRSHYVIEAAYQLSVLSNHAEAAIISKINSFLTFSFYYQF